MVGLSGRGWPRTLCLWVAAAAALASLAPAAAAPARQGATGSAAVRALPVGTDWDYQIGGARAPGRGVGIVVRDRTVPSAGRYDVCYVNAFQTQPGERGFWRSPDRRHLLLRRGGEPVVDGAWGEQLLDTRTATKRRALAGVMATWMGGCARSGYEAVELDNLDSWTRSRGTLSRSHNVAYARLLINRAHRRGLAVAQKNTPQLRAEGRRMGFDFAVAEECGRWNECDAYTAVHGRRVVLVEYRRADFDRACARWGDRLPIILRDLGVTPGGPRARC